MLIGLWYTILISLTEVQGKTGIVRPTEMWATFNTSLTNKRNKQLMKNLTVGDKVKPSKTCRPAGDASEMTIIEVLESNPPKYRVDVYPFLFEEHELEKLETWENT